MDKIIAIDAMGGDFAPAEVVRGSVEALAEFSEIKLVLVGNESDISCELSKFNYDKSKIEIVNATEVIGFDEVPTAAIRTKKDSSIVVGLNLVKSKKAKAFVSAGSTGALLSGATLIIGRIKGVERPALATLIPNQSGHTCLIDSGANAECKPNFLYQFGLMGSLYMENIRKIKHPRVGLINIGTEKEKGNTLTHEAYELMEKAGYNFIGNVEAKEMPLGALDVAVCDGFVGNVILKYSEGFAKGMLTLIKKELMADFVSKIGALLSKSAFKRLKKSFDPSEVGGAAFLGLNGLVVKAHGSSDAKAFKNAIRQCVEYIETDMTAKLEAAIATSDLKSLDLK